MSWNHRVIVRFESNGTPYFEIHECYYEDQNREIPTSWTENAIPVHGDNIDELKETLERMLRACNTPILIETSDDIIEEWKP